MGWIFALMNPQIVIQYIIEHTNLNTTNTVKHELYLNIKQLDIYKALHKMEN